MDKRIKHVDESYFDNLNDKKSWILGLLASDGNVHNNIITITQSGDNGKDIIEYVKNEIQCNNHIGVSNTSRKKSYRINFSSEKIKNILALYGIVERKSLVFLFPNILPSNFEKSFIRGYFEGDGSVGSYKNKNKTRLLIASIFGTQSFIESCYNKIPIKGIVGKTNKSGSNEIRWNGKNAIMFLEWLYDNKELYFGRKYEILMKHIFEHQNKDRYLKYRQQKKESLIMIDKGISPIIISKIFKIPFQTIYKWRKDNYEKR